MKNRLIPCVLACLMIFLVGCTGNTAKEAAQEITLSPLTIAKVLGIPRSTANDLMNDGIVDFIWVDGKRRIKRESFDKWYASQSKYTKVREIEEVEGYVD